jgi:rhamnogalacturonyl hydrolase YesR
LNTQAALAVGLGLSALALLSGPAMAAGYDYVADPAFARELRKDPLVDKAIVAMMGFQRESWEQGVAGQALIEAGEQDAAIALARASLVYISRDGVAGATGGSSMDPLMLGDTLNWAARRTGDPRLARAARDMLRFALKGAPRAKDGTLYHQSSSGQVWSDESFTAAPFLATEGRYDEAVAQMKGIIGRLWDPGTRLMRHIWSEPDHAFVDPSHWGGGNGWTAAALARVIRSLPPERRADRSCLAGQLRELLDGCLNRQRADGLFHNEPDNPGTFVETNLASMLAYAIYESVRDGSLPDMYLPAADRMRAAVRTRVDRFGFVQGVAGAPGFDRPGISTEGQAFFVLMEAAGRKAGRNPGS